MHLLPEWELYERGWSSKIRRERSGLLSRLSLALAWAPPTRNKLVQPFHSSGNCSHSDVPSKPQNTHNVSSVPLQLCYQSQPKHQCPSVKPFSSKASSRGVTNRLTLLCLIKAHQGGLLSQRLWRTVRHPWPSCSDLAILVFSLGPFPVCKGQVTAMNGKGPEKPHKRGSTSVSRKEMWGQRRGKEAGGELAMQDGEPYF